jgi:glycosyltransferase involved in cell wall biosynthesis
VTSSWPAPPPPVVMPSELPLLSRPPRIKVLHVITAFAAGAGGNTLLSATGMDPDRYEVWIAGADGGPLWERAERAGVRTVRFPRLRREASPVDDFSVLFDLVTLIRRERFSIVHAHSAKGGFLGRLAAWLTGTPVIVYSLHGSDPWWPSRGSRRGSELGDLMSWPKRRLFLLMERALRPVTDGFIAVAPTVARDAVEVGLARPGSVDVAPSAVDLDRIPYDRDPSVRAELGIPERAPLVGSVGRLDAQKAPQDFVRMAAVVRRTHPDARFVMVGDGELAGAAAQEASRLGVDILFTGFRSDAPRIASAVDVFVVSSLYEGVGRSVTEALASGRPVVATCVDGVVDVVRPGATGLLAPPRDPAALAACVSWMLDHPDEACRMGQQGRRFVRSLFDPAVMCSAIERTYGRLLGLPRTDDDRPAAGTDLEPRRKESRGDPRHGSLPARPPALSHHG